VYQGESRHAADNELLGEFVFGGFARARRGEVQIEVTFEINSDGIVNVTARDPSTGQKASTQITLSSGLSEEEIQRIIARSESQEGSRPAAKTASRDGRLPPGAAAAAFAASVGTVGAQAPAPPAPPVPPVSPVVPDPVISAREPAGDLLSDSDAAAGEDLVEYSHTESAETPSPGAASDIYEGGAGEDIEVLQDTMPEISPPELDAAGDASAVAHEAAERMDIEIDLDPHDTEDFPIEIGDRSFFAPQGTDLSSADGSNDDPDDSTTPGKPRKD
jgi:hypothetical protein